jgi:DNA-binding transcriptional ArsR family regulator
MTSAHMASFGALIGDPTRARILETLMSGRAQTGTELSRIVGVAPSTVSEHLSKLLDGGLVEVYAQGRHRYYTLADDGVARLLEAVGARARTPATLPRVPSDLAWIRTCYDHLAGELAVRLYDGLVGAGHLEPGPDPRLTASGEHLLAKLGIDLDELRAGRQPLVRACLDWTARRPHLGGAVGAALLEQLLADGSLAHGPRPRSVRVTRAGKRRLAADLGLFPSSSPIPV